MRRGPLPESERAHTSCHRSAVAMRAHYCTYARQPPRRSNIRARGTISANAKPEGKPDKKTNGCPTRTDAKAKQGSPLLRNVQDRREETSLPSSIGPSSLR
ncbi:hypothetical protein MRX96_021343 [Rhipicephalus microplus]